MLFFVLPIGLYFKFPIALKVVLITAAVSYIIVVSYKLRLFNRKDLIVFKGFNYWPFLVIFFGLIALGSYLYMTTYHPGKLFIVIKQSPLFWLKMILIYSFFSVYPQEFIYRSYFFSRYEKLLDKKWLVLTNVLAFPMAHLFFQSWLVLGITLIGGLLFAVSYLKTKSLILTSVEHAIYGSWLFTIGMGEMLGFPLPH